ncbi:hypothetical protein QBC41DRAFT_350470 [Cercophora samala]|uniref:Rhodopsin domain-containing protein n=1 Tax=Cercophora samala TaxID=330535 RepID=A0AA39Z0T0_9PEZI|nr:hypothetical protein QBC41DRAFT_350470 [Cercophora samala]
MSENAVSKGGYGEALIPWQAFHGIIWGLTGLTLISLGVRLTTRWKTFHKLFWDDILVIFAWIMVFINSVVWATQWWNMYAIVWWGAGKQAFPPPLKDIRQWMNCMLAMQLLVFICIFIIKVALCLFFKRLYGNSETKKQKYYWWATLISCAIVFILSMTIIQYKCYTNDFIYQNDHCNSGWFVTESLIISTVLTTLSIVTDIMILAIPVSMVWNLRIRWRKKLALISLFSLTIITIVVGIVRVSILYTTRFNEGSIDPVAFIFWWSVEAYISLLIACLSSFPQLFVRSKPRQAEKPIPTASMIERVRRRMARGGRAPTRPDPVLVTTKDTLFTDTTTGATGTTASRARPDLEVDTNDTSAPSLVPKQGWTGSATTTTQITSPVENEEEPDESRDGVRQRLEYQVDRDNAAVPRKQNDSPV